MKKEGTIMKIAKGLVAALAISTIATGCSQEKKMSMETVLAEQNNLVNSAVNWEQLSQPLTKEQINEYIEQVCESYSVPVELVKAIIESSSNFQHSYVSPEGYIGLMQISPFTASLSEWDVNDPKENIMIGTSILAEYLETFDGDELLALVAYHAGQGTVERWIEYGIDFKNYDEIPGGEVGDIVKKSLEAYNDANNL